MGREAGMKCNFKRPEKRNKRTGHQVIQKKNEFKHSAWGFNLIGWITRQANKKKIKQKIKITNKSGMKMDFIYGINAKQTKKWKTTKG